jgi:copper homeostasis protein
MTLEIIVTDADEAAAAAHAGATRLELVAERDRGGLTPAPETIERVTRAVTIPVHVIVRPHDDGFRYDARSRAAMARDAQRAACLGASAIVVGGLDENGDVDVELLAQVHEAARLSLTFHRAFDDARDLLGAYDTLARTPGVTRVLTSGAAPSAWDGRATLRALRERRGPGILAGGGITTDNVADLVRETGICEVHVGSGARTDGRLNPRAIEHLARTLKAIEE